MLEDDIWGLLAPLFQQTDTHNDEQDVSSTDAQCVVERWDIKFHELKNVLTEIAAIEPAKATHQATEEATTLEEFGW